MQAHGRWLFGKVAAKSSLFLACPLTEEVDEVLHLAAVVQLSAVLVHQGQCCCPVFWVGLLSDVVRVPMTHGVCLSQQLQRMLLHLVCREDRVV